MGAAFKPGTDDIRDSPALVVAADLIAAGADVAVHDPKALQAVRVEQPLIDCVEDPADVLDGAAVLLHLTHWDAYRDADPAVLAARPTIAHVIDA